VVLVPTPGTVAVIHVPPTEPTYGEMDMSLGSRLIPAVITELPAGLPAG